MRDALNLKMLPLAEENINDIDLNPTMRFISSNCYYGYQNPGQIHHKLNDNVAEETPMNTDDHCDKGENFEEKMEINVSRLVSRKRAWEYGYSQQLPDFKKRREDDSRSSKMNISRPYNHHHSVVSRDIHLLEELLRGTHGSSSYHWNCDPEF